MPTRLTFMGPPGGPGPPQPVWPSGSPFEASVLINRQEDMYGDNEEEEKAVMAVERSVIGSRTEDEDEDGGEGQDDEEDR